MNRIKAYICNVGIRECVAVVEPVATYLCFVIIISFCYGLSSKFDVNQEKHIVFEVVGVARARMQRCVLCIARWNNSTFEFSVGIFAGFFFSLSRFIADCKIHTTIDIKESHL